ncbi:MAG: type II toxin-antitoxin system VapC family toxin [Desulfococcaceae bacterium]
MILLDTHIWIWLADGSDRIAQGHAEKIEAHEGTGIGISVISCWEVGKLVEYNRLKLACTVEEWMNGALALPGIQLVELSPRIAIESTQLPGAFHKDPADQIIVATARVLGLELLTVDEKILRYPHVQAE